MRNTSVRHVAISAHARVILVVRDFESYPLGITAELQARTQPQRISFELVTWSRLCDGGRRGVSSAARRGPHKCESARRWWTRSSREDAGAMCWRQVSRFQRSLLVLLGYLALYLLVSYTLTPDATVSFVRDELRLGDKYVLMFLLAPDAPPYSDVDGAHVFAARRCPACFLTNNRGFLPLSEYDAVLVLGERGLLTHSAAVMDPGKHYLLQARRRCVASKLRHCVREPVLTSFSSRETFDLCGLCAALQQQRQQRQQPRVL
ncbi:unnamed protein product [Chrysodeixis includens]|uniref:Uncharacterized protein n=1 Tax=Chrysodeixis includens TaxID=689277 RepID=A0A9N8KYJ1_CHRIL|nr:unnamed protein product [Chrysodeixis includens]